MSRTGSRSRLFLGLALLAFVPAGPAAAHSGIPQSYVYVANYFGDRGVDVYRADISGPRVVRSIHEGIRHPDAIWVDGSGTLYVANAGANDVTVYAPGASRPKLVVRDGLHLPDAVTTDANGDLWVANAERANVVEYAPGGVHPIATLTDGIVLADGLAFDAAGNLYVANYISSRQYVEPGNVQVYPPGAMSPAVTILAGISAPTSIAIDANQTLYVADYLSTGAIAEYAAGATSPTLTVTSGTTYPTSVAVDRAGIMYVGSGFLDVVSEYALGGTYSIGTIQGRGLDPVALAVYPAPNP